MDSLASRAAAAVAGTTAALSVVCAFYVSYGYPWPSVGCAMLACVATVWAVKGSGTPARRMSDVIGDIEGEPAGAAPTRGTW